MLSDRRRKLAVIHIAKKQLGLDENCYRSLLFGACGVQSAGELVSEDQYRLVMTAMRKAGYRPGRAVRTFTAPDPQMAKCYALWCELYHRGAVQSKAWGSMMVWVERQLGGAQDIIRRDQKILLIEELKNWERRVLDTSEPGGAK